MTLTFSAEQFINMLANYNQGVWPAQAILSLLAIIILFLLLRPSRRAPQVILFILATIWLWMGVAYHWVYFSTINPLAKIFALIFVLQAAMFLYYSLYAKGFKFSLKRNLTSYAGTFLIFAGVALYPFLSYLLGHNFSDNPSFGLPCPTTIFTLGVLLLGIGLPRRLFLIPILWSVTGFSFAWALDFKEDFLLLFSGLLSALLVIFRRAR